MLRTLRLLVPGLCAAAIASTAPAADFPARPVTVVVPFPAGATTDTIVTTTVADEPVGFGAHRDLEVPIRETPPHHDSTPIDFNVSAIH